MKRVNSKHLRGLSKGSSIWTMKKRSAIILRRGEIWWISFDPSIVGEVKKTRPAVIVSNDIANKALNRVQVIPITSVIRIIYPAECLITVQGK